MTTDYAIVHPDDVYGDGLVALVAVRAPRARRDAHGGRRPANVQRRRGHENVRDW
jgi:hypothetical protein